MKLHAVDDGWSRKVPPALRPTELTTTQLEHLTELLTWNGHLTQIRRELTVALEAYDYEIAARCARKLYSAGEKFLAIARRMEREL